MQGREKGPLWNLRWGVEREAHRMLPDGSLSRSPHPTTLRAPTYTRDFAESQLELVTSPQPGIPEVLSELARVTLTADRILGNELLWPFSMPPRLPEESRIQIADFGAGEVARRAMLYREGLALRYGRARQMICGVHVNASPGPELMAFLSERSPLTREESEAGTLLDGFLLRLARNLYADLPHFVLLLGASPVKGEGSTAQPFAISYRNSPHGYARGEFLPYLDLESMEAYFAGIDRGLRTESAPFARLGLFHDGRPAQLNAMVFQIEKEFYAPIRLRRTPAATDSSHGIGYLELRFLDVDPFSRIGLSEDTLRLLHLFLLDGLTRPSTPRTNAVLGGDAQAAADVAMGDPYSPIKSAHLELARRRLFDLELWAERLDSEEYSYGKCLRRFSSRIIDPRALPSAMFAAAFTDSGLDWTSFGIRTARVHRQITAKTRPSVKQSLNFSDL